MPRIQLRYLIKNPNDLIYSFVLALVSPLGNGRGVQKNGPPLEVTLWFEYEKFIIFYLVGAGTCMGAYMRAMPSLVTVFTR